MEGNQTQSQGAQTQSVQVTPELLQQIRAAGYTARNAEEEAVFLENYGKDKANRVTSDLWNGIDADLRTLSGIEKLQNEKTYEYMKRVIATTQDSAKTAKEQAKKLESDIKDGKFESIFREKYESSSQQLEATKNILNQREREFEQKINEIHEDYFQRSVAKDVGMTINELIAPVANESMRELLEIGLNDFFVKNVKVTRVMNERGEMEIVYSDKKTGEQFKSKENYAPLKLNEILALDKKSNSIITQEMSKKSTTTGTNSGRMGTQNGKQQSVAIVVDPNMTKANLMNILNQKHQAGSAALIQEYSDYSKKYMESYGKPMAER